MSKPPVSSILLLELEGLKEHMFSVQAQVGKCMVSLKAQSEDVCDVLARMETVTAIVKASEIVQGSNSQGVRTSYEDSVNIIGDNEEMEKISVIGDGVTQGSLFQDHNDNETMSNRQTDENSEEMGTDILNFEFLDLPTTDQGLLSKGSREEIGEYTKVTVTDNKVFAAEAGEKISSNNDNVHEDCIENNVLSSTRPSLSRKFKPTRETSLVSNINRKINGEKEIRVKLEEEIGKVKTEQGEQAKLVKKLQRKLLLVTKERDSYKGILDSYEKEITMTGGQMDQERIMALEKNIEEYRAMVDMLEEEKGGSSPKTKEAPNTVMDEKLRLLEEKNERLEVELERRAIKGDFDPVDTKVLHFTNNPTAQAVEKRAAQMSEVTTENTALKARIELLEQGQTTDLTMMVGTKVEEGEAEKVQELKEQLEKADVRKQRLMEAFKKTFHDFREVVYHLTGYRIDVLSENKYRMLPLYAESQEDTLLFRKSKTGEIQMLESEFSLELGELMEEHLERNNSIPMFLAGLIMQLYYKQNGGGEEDQEEEEEAEGSDTGGEGSTNSDDVGEIIEIDDD